MIHSFLKKIVALSLSLVVVGAIASHAKPAFAAMPNVSGTRIGNVVTYVNNYDEVANATIADGNYNYFYTGANKKATFTASSNAINFSYGAAVTYTRMLKRYGMRFVWVNVYMQDGYYLWMSIPAHSTVTVTATLLN